MFNGCPFPPFRFGGFCPVICGTFAWGDLGGMCASPGCLALPLRCSVESVKQLAAPPPRARSLTLSHTRAHTTARTHTHCAGSLLSLRAVFGHRARASPARPAPSSRAERTIRGPARRGAGRRGREGAGTPDRGPPGGSGHPGRAVRLPPWRCRARGRGGTGRAATPAQPASRCRTVNVAFCFPTDCCWFEPEKGRKFPVAKLQQGRKIPKLCSLLTGRAWREGRVA